MYKKNLKVTVECTTYCNARCPQCVRNKSRVNTKDSNLIEKAEKVERLPLVHWDMGTFKKYFPLETISGISTMHFSGSIGDPGMNPWLIDFVDYLTSNDVFVSINTNGSMHNENWWWKMGMIGGKKLKVVFDIDGTTQEMHAKYRIGTNLQKILNNMKALSDSEAHVESFTVFFKHNQDHLEDIFKLCKEYGATSHDYVESNRFRNGPTFKFLNSDNEVEILEQVTKPELKADTNRIHRRVRDHETYSVIDSFNTIDCMSIETNDVYVQYDGTLLPCCYLGFHKERLLFGDPYTGPHTEHPVYRYMMDNQNDLNLNHYSLKEILNNKWYRDILPNSFIDNPFHTCKWTCGKCEK